MSKKTISAAVEVKVEPGEEATAVALDVEPLLIDANREHGQMRRQDPADVAEKHPQLVRPGS